MSQTKLTIEVETSYAAFEDNPNELNELLENAIERVSEGYEGGHLFDHNGNKVGSWSLDLVGGE